MEIGGNWKLERSFFFLENENEDHPNFHSFQKGMKKYMRIDKFLKVARVIKRRTVANDAADNGRVFVNGKQVKPSYEIKVGDVVEIKFGDKLAKFEVLIVPEKQVKNVDELIKVL